MVYQQKWYVVITGTEPGVYPTWIEAGPKTKNIPGGSIYQSFPSEAEAIRAFEAAEARGDVKAYPDVGKKDKSTSKLKKAPLSPLGPDVSLLKTPLDLKGEIESAGFQTPPSSPARLRVAKLKQTLWDSTAADSYSTVFPSPPTHVTQVNPPLVYDGPLDCPAVQSSPHFTFTSSSSRAYPSISDRHLLEMNVEEMLPLQLDVSDCDSESPSPTPPTSDSYPGADEHTPKLTRCMPLHQEPPSRSKGVKYRDLTGLADEASVDPRIWLPKSRVFDPDKVKLRPSRRSLSPAKKHIYPVSSALSHETVGSSTQLRHQVLSVDSPFVSVGRGRHSRLTPSASLPILPDQQLEDECLSCGSLLKNCAGKGKGMDLAEQLTGCSTGLGNDISRSHVQLVSRDGRDGRSAIVVRCPRNCPHETCPRSPSAMPSRLTGSRYVDACVSPIIRTQSADSPAKTCSRAPNLEGDRRCVPVTHILHQGLAVEADVRSPIAKGTMVPMNATE